MTRPAPRCAGTVTPDDDPWFDPTRGDDVQRICSGCPVTSCLADALERGERHGWWQSTWLGAPETDDVMVVAEPATLRVAIASQHGSRGRYASGCRCRPCTDANAAYVRGYRDHGPVTTRETIEQFEQMTIGV